MLKPLMVVGIVSFLLSACVVNDEAVVESQSRQSDITVCTEPRPQMCTREYNPVCATRDTGVRCVTEPCPASERLTYPTGCTACADPKVISHVSAACPDTVE